MGKRAMVLGMAVALAFGAAACGDDDGDEGAASATTASPAAGGAGGDCPQVQGGTAAEPGTVGAVAYELDEFEFAGPASVPAGAVTFELTNVGQANHEMVVIKAETFDELPTNEHGTVVVDELPDGAFIGEIGRFPGEGTTCAGQFDLEPGRYVLVCNIEFQNGPQVVSHAGRGMHLDIDVA